jgi:hypothetical protein
MNNDGIYSPHDGSHTECPRCFQIKLASIQMQGPAAGARRQSEKERERDMREYKTMRNQGYQPKNIFGSAEVAAQAGSQWEVEHAVVMAPDIRKEMLAKIKAGNEITGNNEKVL